MIPVSRSLLKYWRNPQDYICFVCQRHISQSSTLRSGHSKWATIKHDKAKNDASRGRQRAVHANEIANAVRHGGSDPTFNPRLSLAIATAKKGGFPKASIEGAIARGLGRSASGAPLENLTIEAVVPPVAIMVDCQTDSKARALQDIRLILKNFGATQTPTAYLFEKRGRVVFQSKEGVGVDEVFESALEAGALDVTTDEDGKIIVDTEVESLRLAEKQITEIVGLEVDTSDTIWFPNVETMVGAEPETLEILYKLKGELEDYPSVQGVFMNLAETELPMQSADAERNS